MLSYNAHSPTGYKLYFQSLWVLILKRKQQEMTRVEYQNFPISSCGKRVGWCNCYSICGESAVLILGDSNLRALINGQYDIAGEILYNTNFGVNRSWCIRKKTV